MVRITASTPADGITKGVEILLINCEINLIQTWSHSKFSITDTKFYVLVVTLLTQDNANLLQQLKSAFKRTLNGNKYQSKVTIHAPNPYLDYLIDPSFHGLNTFYFII